MSRKNKLLTVALIFGISFAPYISTAAVSPELVGFLKANPSMVDKAAVGSLIAEGAGSQVANIMCASYTYAEGYRYCFDVTFGIPTPGMCVGTATCLGLGTVAITGAVIGVGMGVVEGIMKGRPEANVISGVPTYGGYAGYSPYTTGGSFTSSPSSGFSQDISNLLAGIFGGSQGVSANLLAPQITSPATPASGFAPQPPVIPPSTSKTKGDVSVNYTGATIQAGVSDAERNIEFVAFFGANVAKNTNPENAVARFCRVRPWQNPLISYVIPYPIFDKLCTGRRHAVGIPVPPPPVPPKKSAKGGSASGGKAATSAIATSTTLAITAKADIWAVPASTPPGGRVNIFWNASGVVGCDLRSSDGTFSADTPYGSSASAPISTTTVFAISCLTPADVRVSNFVTVKVGI